MGRTSTRNHLLLPGNLTSSQEQKNSRDVSLRASTNQNFLKSYYKEKDNHQIQQSLIKGTSYQEIKAARSTNQIAN